MGGYVEIKNSGEEGGVCSDILPASSRSMREAEAGVRVEKSKSGIKGYPGRAQIDGHY